MLLELIFYPLFSFARFILSLIPNFNGVNGEITGVFYELLSIGFYFFGAAPFMMVFASVVFWVGVDIGWTSIEWLYKKIPGVD